MAADATTPAVLVSAQFVDSCDTSTTGIRLCHCHTSTKQHGEGAHNNLLHELKPPDKGSDVDYVDIFTSSPRA
jgi:hypothetical protein